MSQKDKKQKKVTEFTEAVGRSKERASGNGTQGGALQAEATATKEPSAQLILQELRDLRTEISQQLGTHGVKLDIMQARIDAIAERHTEAEVRIQALEDRLPPTEKTCLELTKSVSAMQAALEDAEGRNRRSNIRILGMPEAASGGRIEEFLETAIPKMLPAAELSSHFVIERAHRIPGLKPKPGAPSRPIIAKLLNYRDRDTILRAARDLGTVEWEGTRISFYQDLTPATVKARKTFDTVKAELRKRGMAYAMLHPAKLRVIVNGKANFFLSPKAAWDYIDSVQQRAARSPRNVDDEI